MSDDFRVGDIVECWRHFAPPVATDPVLGGLYTVTAVSLRPSGWWALQLRELPPVGDGKWGWKAYCFRKIHRPRAAFLTELLEAPVGLPEHEPETA